MADFLSNFKIEEKKEQPALLNFEEMNMIQNKAEEETKLSKKETEKGDEPEKENSVEKKLYTYDELQNLDDSDEDDEQEDLDDKTDKSKKDDALKSSSEKTTSSNKTSKGVFHNYMKLLAEEAGVQFSLEDYEDSAKGMKDFIDDLKYLEANSTVEKYIRENLNYYQQKFVELVEEGVDEEDASEFIKGIKFLESIDEDKIEYDENIAKKVYTQYLKKTTKFTDERIKEELKDLNDLGILTDKAKKVLPELKKLQEEEEKAMLESVRKAQQEQYRNAQIQAQKLQEYLNSVEEIGGIKLNKKLREKWKSEYEFIKTEDGRAVRPIVLTREIAPEKFDALLSLYHAIGLFKFDKRKNDFVPDFSVLTNLGKADALKEIEKAIENEHEKRIANGGKSIEDIEIGNEKELHLKRLIEYAKKQGI